MRRQITTLLTWGTCIALVIVAIIWFSRDQEVTKTSPAIPKTAVDSAAIQRDSIPPRAQDLASPAARIPSSQSGLPGSPAVHLRFQGPSSARVGEAFDYVVTIDAQQAVGRIALEISYDPALLRVRTAEEIDYTNRPHEEGRFSTEETGDGRVAVVMVRDGSRPVLGSLRMAVVQFEALASGSAQISVSNISASDSTGRAVSLDVSDRESAVALD
jgi:Cohesin domain